MTTLEHVHRTVAITVSETEAPLLWVCTDCDTQWSEQPPPTERPLPKSLWTIAHECQVP